MTIKLPQITPEQIYVSRINYHWVVGDEGWGRMEPVDKTFVPTGSIIMDAIARILAETQVSAPSGVSAILQVELSDLRGAVRVLTGMTLDDFIFAYRLLEAKELLTKTNLSIAEITTRMGKRSQASFCRLMQRHLKYSPLDYRRIYREPNYQNLYKL